MARKARNIPIPRGKISSAAAGDSIEPIGIQYRTAIYIRLSREDGGKEHSNTVDNQKTLLLQYVAARKDMTLANIYIDNGYSGTNFERPAFSKMMEDVRWGRINCIVVKDLSRLGRSYLESGNYIETIFPFFKTRFVAVNDNFDTLCVERDESGMTVPLKNIINEIYAKDISRKISASLELKKKEGRYGGGLAPYGYRKSVVQRGKYEVDEEAAHVVEYIFQMRAEGLGYCAIVKRLNEEGIKSPSAYRYEKGVVKNEKLKDTLWKIYTIQDMVRDEVYLGNMVRGKTRSAFYKGEKRHAVPADQRIVVKGTHKPIITEELFAKVQAVNAERTAKHAQNMALAQETERRENLFTGKIFCGDCGRTMEYKRNGDSISFYCFSYKQNGELGCRKKSVSHRNLEKIVLETARGHLSLFKKYKEIVKCANRGVMAENERTVLDEKIARHSGELICFQQKKKELYLNYKEGLISVREYSVLKQTYEAEAAKVRQRLEELREEQKCLQDNYGDEWEFSKLAEAYGQAETLTKEMVNSLIERIEVFPEKKVHIAFQYCSQFEEMERKAQSIGQEAGCEKV